MPRGPEAERRRGVVDSIPRALAPSRPWVLVTGRTGGPPPLKGFGSRSIASGTTKRWRYGEELSGEESLSELSGVCHWRIGVRLTPAAVARAFLVLSLAR